MTNKIHKISNLDSVLKNILIPNKTLVDYESKYLTNTGENYGSLMLDLTLKIRNKENNEEESVSVVGKMCPLNDFLKKEFKVHITMKKEIAIYTTFLDTFQHFTKEFGGNENLDFLARCLGSRLNLTSSANVDDDAIIILENLKNSGYETVDRFTGFDYETVRIILRTLAVFHGIPIAFKILKPKQFKEILMPHLGHVADEDEDELPNKGIEEKMISQIVNAFSQDNKEAQELSLTLKEILEIQFQNFRKPIKPNEQFGTVSHNDLWVNNIMVKYVDGKPSSVKLVDFQLYSYGSLARDLIFFLLTSVRKDILKEKYDEFIGLYHKSLVNVLEKFQCNTTSFLLNKIHEEIEFVTKNSELFHVLMMLKPIFAERGLIKDMAEFDMDAFLDDEGTELFKKNLTDTLLFAKCRGLI